MMRIALGPTPCSASNSFFGEPGKVPEVLDACTVERAACRLADGRREVTVHCFALS